MGFMSVWRGKDLVRTQDLIGFGKVLVRLVRLGYRMGNGQAKVS